jgi:hypothetical protein
MSRMDDNEVVSQTECLIRSVNEIPGPVNGYETPEDDRLQARVRETEAHVPWWRR